MSSCGLYREGSRGGCSIKLPIFLFKLCHKTVAVPPSIPSPIRKSASGRRSKAGPGFKAVLYSKRNVPLEETVWSELPIQSQQTERAAIELLRLSDLGLPPRRLGSPQSAFVASPSASLSFQWEYHIRYYVWIRTYCRPEVARILSLRSFSCLVSAVLTE